MPDPWRVTGGVWPGGRRALVAVGWVALALSLVAGATGRFPALTSDGSPLSLKSARLEAVARAAEETMRHAEDLVAVAKRDAGIVVNPEIGQDRSGLLGDEVTPLMTTLGNLEAKRLSTNPAWAGVLVQRLAGAGIGRGDLVAAGFSGSFPGLNLALMSACHALGVDLIAVSSVTASTWGANQPGFTWPEIEVRLVESGLLPRASVAVSAGGDADQGLDLDPEGQALAAAIRDNTAARLGVRRLVPRDFDAAVDERVEVLRAAAKGRPIRLYVNVGGADASLGRSGEILRYRSGFLPAVPLGRPADRGAMGRLAAEGVPALLLLNVRDLALRWGVPFEGR